MRKLIFCSTGCRTHYLFLTFKMVEKVYKGIFKCFATSVFTEPLLTDRIASFRLCLTDPWNLLKVNWLCLHNIPQSMRTNLIFGLLRVQPEELPIVMLTDHRNIKYLGFFQGHWDYITIIELHACARFYFKSYKIWALDSVSTQWALVFIQLRASQYSVSIHVTLLIFNEWSVQV